MKTQTLMMITILFIIGSCKPGEEQPAQKAVFGIYEIVTQYEIPAVVMDSLKLMHIQLESNAQMSILGYITKDDSSVLQYAPKEQLKLWKTHYMADENHGYFAIVALKPGPVLSNSDIQSTMSNGTRLDIRFNMAGAHKWSDLTRKNTGKMLAFAIDNEIYTMPFINNEIKNGTAQMNFKDALTAKKISNRLSSDIR